MTFDIHIGPLRILWNKPVVTRLESYENATRVLRDATQARLRYEKAVGPPGCTETGSTGRVALY